MKDQLLKIFIGRYKASSIAGLLASWAYAWLGTDMPVTNPKVLIPSMLIYLVGRFLPDGSMVAATDGPRERNTAAPSPYEREAAGEVARFRSRIVELERECERLHTAWHNAVSQNQASEIIPVRQSSDAQESARRAIGTRVGTFLPLLLWGCLLLSQAACGSAQLDQLLLWSDRVVGYTDTARSLVLDFYCEDCGEHKITKEQSLITLRTLQGLHNANGEIYRVLRVGMNADQTAITLNTKQRATIESQIPLLKDKVNYYAATLPPDSVKRLQPTTKLLTSAVNEFVGQIARAPVNDKGVVTISLTPEQRGKFYQQYARVMRVNEDLEAAINE